MRNKQEDLLKLADAFFLNLRFDPSFEYGSLGTDCKRPFGNSDVEGDILDIIGAKPEGDDGEEECWSRAQREYAAELYQEELGPFIAREWQRLRGISTEVQS